jgi:Spy/CpxP family protein refolding chaperone
MKTLKHDLNLTKEQKEKIKGIRKDFNTKILALRKKIQDNNKSLRKLMLTQYSESELDKLADARGKLVADTVKIRFHFKKAVHEVLTSEQKDKIKKLQAERLKHLKK